MPPKRSARIQARLEHFVKPAEDNVQRDHVPRDGHTIRERQRNNRRQNLRRSQQQQHEEHQKEEVNGSINNQGK
jgi:hypothetical protein